MYLLHAINSDRQTRLLNVLGQIAMYWEGEKNLKGLRKKKTKTSKKLAGLWAEILIRDFPGTEQVCYPLDRWVVL